MLLEPAPAPFGDAPRPLRVLHVVQHLKSGGAETFVRSLVRGLRDDPGLAVSVLSLYPDALDAAERTALGVPVVSLERRGRGDIARFYPRLVRAIRAVAPDIVHAHLHAGKYAGRIGAIVAGVPAIVFTEHGDEAGGVLRRIANATLHPRTRRFVVFNDAQRRAFAAREGVSLERVVAIPNGVTEPPPGDRAEIRRELGLATDAFVLFLPARMTAQKDHVLAVRAFSRAFAADSGARLVLAGAGPLEDDIRATARELGVTERVLFAGFRDDVPRLMRAMDVFVMSSVWEKMPIALGEAMRAGLPVVTTPWDGASDVVSDGATGIVSSDRSVEAFADALLRARPAETRARIAAHARAFAADTFLARADVARHAALYAEIAREMGLRR